MKYIRKLNPKNSAFFQQPKEYFGDGDSYKNCPIGHNVLGGMMANISDQAGLSKKYTNHSLRATTVHILDSANIPTRHIMTVTGH